MIRKILSFFDRLEDRVRAKLSHAPIVYALVGGAGTVLFWRGIWHMADDANLDSFLSLVIGTIILLITGVFVSSFIGNRLIMTGLKGEKKLAEKTEDEIVDEKTDIKHISAELATIEKELEKIEHKINKHTS